MSRSHDKAAYFHLRFWKSRVRFWYIAVFCVCDCVVKIWLKVAKYVPKSPKCYFLYRKSQSSNKKGTVLEMMLSLCTCLKKLQKNTERLYSTTRIIHHVTGNQSLEWIMKSAFWLEAPTLIAFLYMCSELEIAVAEQWTQWLWLLDLQSFRRHLKTFLLQQSFCL